jgi:hypothetical protein
MKGIINKTLLAGGCMGLLGAGVGCETLYRDLVDPCYPQRYEYAARQEVHAAYAPQVQNGHVLDQTVWNYHFDPGTDRLNPAGLEHLAYLARRRPQPDPMVYLQTAQDLSYDPANPDRYDQGRADLDSRRIAAIQKYLNTQTAGRHMDFVVTIHDPSPEVGLPAVPAATTIQRLYSGYQGNLPSGAAAGVSGGGGSGGK